MLSDTTKKPYLFYIIVVGGVLFSILLRLDLGFNGGQIDEYDYLFVGKQLLAGQTWDTYSYIFGSDLNWYLLGIGDHLGGLTGSRIITFLLGLLSLLGLYLFILNLWHSKAIALLSTALLSMQATHIFISRFATYDIIALAFLSLTLPVLWYALHEPSRKRYLSLILAIILFSLAMTGKYIDVVYFPLLGLVALILSPRIGFLFSLGVGVVLGLYLWMHWADLQTLYEVQIKGTHASNSSYTQILERELLYLAIPILFWFLALVWHNIEQKKQFWRSKTTWVFFCFMLFALPLVAYHMNGRNMISLYKHMVYGAFFLTPVMAWFIWEVLVRFKFNLWLQTLLSMLIISMVWYNFFLLKEMENGYPDARPVVKLLQTLPVDGNTTVASEDPYLGRYAMFDTMDQTHIKELYWLDNNLDGKYDMIDTIDALWDRKFTYVFLNDLIQPELNEEVRKIMEIRGYEKILNIPWESTQVMSYIDNGSLQVYKRNGIPSVPTDEDKLFKTHIEY